MTSSLSRVLPRFGLRRVGKKLLWNRPATLSQRVSFSTAASDSFWADEDNQESTTERAEEKERLRKAEIMEALDNKTGRGWTDPYDLEEAIDAKLKYEDLQDWSPKYVSRISQERVQLHPDKIPSLETIAALPLPPPPLPHPGQQPKLYALHRKRKQYEYLADKVRQLAEAKIPDIQKLSTWEEKQDAVDALFENIEFQLRDSEPVLRAHPSFSSWVERALEEYLVAVRKNNTDIPQTADDLALPVFMDVHDETKDSAERVAPHIVHPLQQHAKEDIIVGGNMVEEWELAALKTSKRIMLRQCIRTIAQALCQSTPCRIVLDGPQGSGKTAALAAIVASARRSGYIVLYMPEGNRLHELGYYVEPNETIDGLYDLPVLSQQTCRDLVASHEADLAAFKVEEKTVHDHFSKNQLQVLTENNVVISDANVGDILALGAKHSSCAAACFMVAMKELMKQEDKPFLIAMDQFNCFYKPGKYFHMDYDEDVNLPIPYDKITLFKPVLDAIALSVEDDAQLAEPVMMKRGAAVVAMTESHAVARDITDKLVQRSRSIAENVAVDTTTPLVQCSVPRLSELETEHMIANYEATGVGKLRLDQGKTVIDSHEMAFLRIVSGGIPQKLLDACIL